MPESDGYGVAPFAVKGDGTAEEEEENPKQIPKPKPKPKTGKNGGQDRKLPEIHWDRYNMVQIGVRVTQDTEKKLKEANTQIQERLGQRFGYNKVIDELVAFSLDDYMKLKLKSIE